MTLWGTNDGSDDDDDDGEENSDHKRAGTQWALGNRHEGMRIHRNRFIMTVLTVRLVVYQLSR